MSNTHFFEIIVSLDDTHTGRIVTEAETLIQAIREIAYRAVGTVIGGRVAVGPATEMRVDEVTRPFSLVGRFDVMIAVKAGFNRINYEVRRNVKAEHAAIACRLSLSTKTTLVGVRMVGGPIGPFTFKGKVL